MIWEEEVPVAAETRIISEDVEVDPLELMGSGALMIVVEQERTGEMASPMIELGVEASVIGEIRPPRDGRVLVLNDGGRIDIEAVDQDEVYRILEKYGLGG